MDASKRFFWQRLHANKFYCLVVFVAAIYSPFIYASTLLIWPVRITLASDQRTAELWLENRSEQNSSLQIRVFEWTQSDGKDNYTPQSTLVASPPFSNIPGNKKQLIRVVRLSPGDNNREQQFRILIDEIPRKDEAGESGVQFQMRYSVPVFLSHGTPLKDVAGYFSKSLRYRLDGSSLVIENQGDYSARIARLSTLDKNKEQHYLTEGLLGYVLPGATMSWVFEKPIESKLFAEVNGQQVELQKAGVQ